MHEFVGGMKYFETSLLGYGNFFHQQSVTFLENLAGNALKMHLGPIFKKFLPCTTMVGSNINKGGDKRGHKKWAAKFKII